MTVSGCSVTESGRVCPSHKCWCPVTSTNSQLFQCDSPLCVECLQGPPSPLIVLRRKTKTQRGRARHAASTKHIVPAHLGLSACCGLLALSEGVGGIGVGLGVGWGRSACSKNPDCFKHAIQNAGFAIPVPIPIPIHFANALLLRVLIAL